MTLSRGDLIGLIEPWMASQRWYANKGLRPALEQLGTFDLGVDCADVGIVTHLFLDRAGPSHVLYQVPLTFRHGALAPPR